MDPETEQRLVEAAKSGDPDAWEALYRDIHPRLVAYLRRRVPFDSVDDVVNETMTRAVAGLDRYRWGSAGFGGWVFGIARRASADHYRGIERDERSARKFRDIEESPPGDALDYRDEYATVRTAFEALSSSDRELLELRVIAGLSIDDTASVLGKRAGAVRTAQSRALARLRARLEEPT